MAIITKQWKKNEQEGKTRIKRNELVILKSSTYS